MLKVQFGEYLAVLQELGLNSIKASSRRICMTVSMPLIPVARPKPRQLAFYSLRTSSTKYRLAECLQNTFTIQQDAGNRPANHVHRSQVHISPGPIPYRCSPRELRLDRSDLNAMILQCFVQGCEGCSCCTTHNEPKPELLLTWTTVASSSRPP